MILSPCNRADARPYPYTHIYYVALLYISSNVRTTYAVILESACHWLLDYVVLVVCVPLQAIHLMVGDVDTREGHTPSDRTRAIFKKMDVNMDKVLTKDEFIWGCLHDEQLYRLLTQNQS